MHLWLAKVITLLLILFLTIFFGLIPVKFVEYLRKRDAQHHGVQLSGSDLVETNSRTKKILSYLNCFSGGVFFGTCLLHLFPEVSERYSKVLLQAKWTFVFPLDELIIACGFFLIMVIEHAAMTIHSQSQNHDKGKDKSDHDNEHTPCLHGSHSSGMNDSYGAAPAILPTQSDAIEPIADRVVEGPAVCNTYLDSYNSNYECDEQPPHHHHPGQTHEQTVKIHAIRSIMLLLALSLHTLFEGLALGLESSVANVWTLFSAVAVHKSIIAFTMGLQFVDTFQQTSRVVLYMLLYAVVCPIGVGIGIGISMVQNQDLALDATSMTLQGIATGTFLYVTFFEVLQKELGVDEHSVTKVLTIIVGFGIIALSNLLEKHK